MSDQGIYLVNDPSLGFGIIVERCNAILLILFGRLGFSEISLEDFLFDHDLEEWRIKFRRKIDDYIQRWELCLDNETGEPTSLRRLQNEE